MFHCHMNHLPGFLLGETFRVGEDNSSIFLKEWAIVSLVFLLFLKILGTKVVQECPPSSREPAFCLIFCKIVDGLVLMFKNHG